MFGLKVCGLFLFGWLAGTVNGDCVREVVKCAHFYRPLSAERVLFGADFDLEKECELQGKYFSCFHFAFARCPDDINKVIIVGDFSYKKLALAQLCSEGTPLRESYMAEASCFSLVRTNHCTSTQYLGADLTAVRKIEERCKLMGEMRRCLFSLLKEKCGMEAARVYKELATAFLSDDICELLLKSVDLDPAGSSVDEHLATKEQEESSDEDSGYPFTCPENDTECQMLLEIGPIVPPSAYDLFEEKSEPANLSAEFLFGSGDLFSTETEDKAAKLAEKLREVLKSMKHQSLMLTWNTLRQFTPLLSNNTA